MAPSERLSQVHAAISHINGVSAINNRTTNFIYVTGNIDTISRVLNALTATYGSPTVSHPLLATISWVFEWGKIELHKAAHMEMTSTAVKLYVF